MRKLHEIRLKKVEDGINRIAIELFRSDRIKKLLYDYLRASSCLLLRFYGRAKIHKANCPVRPVISSVGTATYNASLYLARLLALIVGNTEHTAKNSKEFVEHVSGLDIADDEVMVSYDVEALYSSLPLGRVLEVTREKLEADGTLSERTSLSVAEIIRLLEFCLKSTFFSFRGKFLSSD